MQPQPEAEIRARILAFGRDLKAAVDRHRGEGCETWHSVLLLALAGELLFDCMELIQGETEGNPCRSAWGARNLLELHYWVRYVTASPENALRFHEDMVCDCQDLLRKLANEGSMVELVRQSNAVVEELSERLETVKLGQKRLEVFEVAKSFNDEVGYATVSKFLSKFVHPTSMSIQLRVTPLLASVILPAILQTAGILIEKTFPVLTQALIEYEPPSDCPGPSASDVAS